MALLPRRPKGPPLNALRAFESAARLESFVSAGEELGVTADEVFSQFSEPVAAASIAQVHRATIAATGEDDAIESKSEAEPKSEEATKMQPNGTKSTDEDGDAATRVVPKQPSQNSH